MRAFTLPFFSSSNAFLLQASLAPHSGNTSLEKTRFFPSGENRTPPASVARFVTCLGFEPSASISQICDAPPRSETNAMRREAGDQRGRSLSCPAWGICLAAPPAPGVNQLCVPRFFVHWGNGPPAG